MRTLVYQSFTPTPSGLACDDVSIESIVERVGTPAYIYSARAIRESYHAIDRAFTIYPHAIHYALKANSTLAIVRLLRSIGSKVDANSGGEIEVARRAGFAPAEIVFTGVGKSRAELESAVADGIGTINAESAGELDRIAEIAHGQGRQARVALRVNPDIDAGSHPKISTGLRINKFGVPLQEARAIYRERRDRPGLTFVGVHTHIGSQITLAEPLRRAARTLATLEEPLPALRKNDELEPAICHRRGSVVVRPSGDKHLLVEFGENRLDLNLRFQVHALEQRLRAEALHGVVDITPGIRSLFRTLSDIKDFDLL